MSRLAALDVDALDERVRPLLEAGRDIMGFLPNDGLTMARDPALLEAFLRLVQVIYAPGRVDPALKRMLGLVASSSAGCNYCVAHTANSARRLGVPLAKLKALCDVDSATDLTSAERAALRVAAGSAVVPSGVSDDDYAELARHFDEDEQLEIVSVIALFGFLNRWNSTLGTELEDDPRATLQKIQPDA